MQDYQGTWDLGPLELWIALKFRWGPLKWNQGIATGNQGHQELENHLAKPIEKIAWKYTKSSGVA